MKPGLCTWLVFSVLLIPVTATGDSAKTYADLPTRKALARASTTETIAHSHQQDLLAAATALAQCEAERNEAEAPCELIRLNDQDITTGAELRSRVPSDDHPLFLWRYDGPEATVYLGGSIHILKPTLYPLPDQMLAAFEASDTLVLEVNPDGIRPEDLQRLVAEVGRLPVGTTLADAIPEPLYKRLEEQAARYGLPLAPLQTFNPSMVMTQFVLTRLLSYGYNPDVGVEKYLLARRGDRRILELETAEAQLRLLFGQPLPTQIQMLEETLEQDADFDQMLAELIVAWMSGDDIAFERLFRDQAGESELAEAFNRQLLDDRNVAMAEQIAHYLTQDGTYFVLVGAAHFIGDKGIVDLLARDGIEGRRITADASI